jgi:glycosyltransferase involved in cell wall biosynthesis
MTEGFLATIVIPTYNCEKYIREAIESALAQTYRNTEIFIQDNQSTDGTYPISLEYAERFPEKVSVFRNVINMGGGTQNLMCAMPHLLRSDGFIYFFSGDDVLLPDCIERCVKAAAKYPTAGLLLIERDEINENGSPRDYRPFFDRTFFCRGEKLLPVLMMSGITTLSQIMVRKSHYQISEGFSNIFLVPTDWNLNFRMALISDVVYLHKPGVEYRVYGSNETGLTTFSTMGIVEHFQMLLDFVRAAKNKGLKAVYGREEAAVAKLGQMALRYAVLMIAEELPDTAMDYLDFAEIFNPKIASDGTFRLLSSYLRGEAGMNKTALLEEIGSAQNMTRTVSYAPPEGFVEFDEEFI